MAKSAKNSAGISMHAEVKHRLFFALWPDAALSVKLHSLAVSLKRLERERLIARSMHHLTLRYVGHVDATTQACLRAMAQKIHLTKFDFNLQSVGYWDKPKVTWLAPTNWPEALNQLVAQLEQGCQRCGREAVTRKYRPHVSLLRKSSVKPIIEKLDPSVTWKATDFALIESKSTKQGVDYVILNRWSLV